MYELGTIIRSGKNNLIISGLGVANSQNYEWNHGQVVKDARRIQ